MPFWKRTEKPSGKTSLPSSPKVQPGQRQSPAPRLPNGDIEGRLQYDAYRSPSHAHTQPDNIPGTRPKTLLLRSTSQLQADKGDLGSYNFGPKAETPLQTSSRLSKTLREVLHDQNAIPYLLQYMDCQNVGHYIKFWLDACSFQASSWTRIHSQSLSALSKSSVVRSKVKEGQGQEKVEGDGTGNCDKDVGVQGQGKETANCDVKTEAVIHGAKYQETKLDTSHSDNTKGARLCDTRGQGHGGEVNQSAATSDSCPQAVIDTASSQRVTSQGEITSACCEKSSQSQNHVLSHTNATVIQQSDIVPASGQNNSSRSPPGNNSTAAGGAAAATDYPPIKSSTDPGHITTDGSTSASDSSSSSTSGVVDSTSPYHHGSSAVADSSLGNQYSDSAIRGSLLKSKFLGVTEEEQLLERLRRSIAQDAVSIYTKYIAQDATHPIGVTDELRSEAISKICREDGQVDPQCFNACQDYIVDVLEGEYFPGFLQSEFHCKHQIDILTGTKVHLADVLYNESAIIYFMEFMEQENARDLLQCWLDLESFQQLLSDSHGQYDGSQAQTDAIVLYEKYFSLQATQPLGFEEKVRFEVEENICRVEGPLPDCFTMPKKIVLRTIDKVYFKGFLQSELYFKYLTELINTIQTAQDVPQFRRKRAGSDASSEHSLGSHSTGSEISSKNTLLATDSSTSNIKKALNKFAGDDMRIDNMFFNPDALWKRDQAGKMSLGKIDEAGRFISEFDPEPDHSRRRKPTFFKKRKDKEQTQEEMALQIARMIVSDITTTTQGAGIADGNSDNDDSFLEQS